MMVSQTDSTCEIFACRLRKLRTNRSLRQRDLAKAIHVSQRYISYLERAKRSPPPDVLVAIAKYFGVSVDGLLGREINERKHTL